MCVEVRAQLEGVSITWVLGTKCGSSGKFPSPLRHINNCNHSQSVCPDYSSSDLQLSMLVIGFSFLSFDLLSRGHIVQAGPATELRMTLNS